MYLCMLEFSRDRQDVGRVVIIGFGFALVLVLRRSLMAAVLVVVQHDVVPAQVQTLSAPVSLPPRPVGEHRVGHQPLAVDRLLPVGVVRRGVVASVIPLVGRDALGLGARAGDAVGAEAAVVQAAAGCGGRRSGRQGAVGGGAGAHAAHRDGPLTGGPAPYAAHARSLERFTPPPTAPAHRGMKGK